MSGTLAPFDGRCLGESVLERRSGVWVCDKNTGGVSLCCLWGLASSSGGCNEVAFLV